MGHFHKRLSWWHIALILGLPLLILFHPSLRSGQVLFSNDGPLGIISSEAGSLPSAFFGYWDDLNWVGQEKPSALLDFSMLLGLIISNSVIFSKVYAPIALFFLGLAGFFLFRSLGFKSIVCLLGACAFAFNMNAFSNACWGLPSRATTLASAIFALGALHLKLRIPFLKFILAGFALGHGIMEGFDVGALYCLVIGAYVVFLSLIEKGEARQKGWNALTRLMIVSVAAALFSAQAIDTLIRTQIKGVSEMSQDVKTKDARWNEATQWSLPAKELLRVAVPGLFGYRMNDESGGMGASSYWGSVGQTEGWEIHGQGLARHSGSGEYAGMLVLCLAAFAFFQNLQNLHNRQSSQNFHNHQNHQNHQSSHNFHNHPFDQKGRMMIWFWSLIAVVSAMLALGKHGPLYHLFYELPFVSMIRNPIKFMHLFHLAVIILFGYGAQALWRSYEAKKMEQKISLKMHLTKWWRSIRGFDRNWNLALGAAWMGLLLCWLIYASSKKEMLQVLEKWAIPNQIAGAIHAFSASELLWSVGFLAVSWALIMLIMSGAMRQSGGRMLAMMMLILMIVDLSRANRFWIVYYDYQKKYASNPIVETLQKDPFEGRLTSTLNPFAPTSLASGKEGLMLRIMSASWLQHQFPFFNIHSLDIVQMPRRQRMDQDFGLNFFPKNLGEGYKYIRLWELTSTRYVLGMSNSVALLNHHFDHGRDRFKLHSLFNFASKSESDSRATKIDDLSPNIDPEGLFALIEFHGALPKVRRYSNWTIQTNETDVLGHLSDLKFDPEKEVVVMNSIEEAQAPFLEGDAMIESYHPKRIRIKTSGTGRGVLLLNDRFHPNWKVYVDGIQKPLLRCNYLMRGVEVSAGEGLVEFRYEPPFLWLAISAISMGIGCILCVFFAIDLRKKQASLLKK